MGGYEVELRLVGGLLREICVIEIDDEELSGVTFPHFCAVLWWMVTSLEWHAILRNCPGI